MCILSYAIGFTLFWQMLPRNDGSAKEEKHTRQKVASPFPVKMPHRITAVSIIDLIHTPFLLPPVLTAIVRCLPVPYCLAANAPSLSRSSPRASASGQQGSHPLPVEQNYWAAQSVSDVKAEWSTVHETVPPERSGPVHAPHPDQNASPSPPFSSAI